MDPMHLNKSQIELLKKYPIYSQEELKDKAKVLMKIFITGTSMSFYVLEGEQEETENGMDWRFFGISCANGELEYGYMSYNELKSINQNYGFVHAEIDRHYDCQTVGELKASLGIE